MLDISIKDDDCNGNPEITISINNLVGESDIVENIQIMYCPICGKDLNRK